MIKNSIGNRVLLVVGVATTLCFWGLLYFYTETQREAILKEHEVAAERLANAVICGLKAVMLTGSAKIAKNFAKEVQESGGMDSFSFLRPDGIVAFQDNQTIVKVNAQLSEQRFALRETTNSIRLIEQDNPLLQKTLNSGKPEKFLDGEQKQLYFYVPIRNQEDCRGCHGNTEDILGIAMLTSNMHKAWETYGEVRSQAVVVLLLVLIVLLGVISLLLKQTILKPISRMITAMNRVEQGDLTQQVPAPGDGEFGQLALTFNAMTKQILETYNGMEQEQGKLTAIILNAGEGIVVTDSDENIVLVNPSAETLLEKSEQEIIQDGMANLVGDPELMEFLLEHPDKNYTSTVAWGRRFLSIMAARIRSPQGGVLGAAALLRDVTAQKRREEFLEAMSYTDELTGLLNRRSLESILAQELASAMEANRRLSLMMLDLDHFKQLNDNYGHDQGDRVLKEFGSMLKQRLRDSDFPCRYGGEEFCVILSGTELEGALTIAEKIRSEVEKKRFDGLQVTISIGVSSLSQCEEYTTAELLKMADKALYKAKDGGRNRVKVYDANAFK